MLLKKIEIQGFKSFANKTELEFNSGITAVVGPNGCGKSNVSDAIKWVLGETSVKSLRGIKMEDVIFNGAVDKKPLGFAMVSIIFDNSDKSLPIEYDEVNITRKLYRSGESEYYINKTACRHKDIIELLYDTGIGQNGYSIISQGEVDRIINSKPEERREIFDEAAGISKYKGKREETIKKINEAKTNIIRINDILSEVTANLEPLRMQAQNAEKYMALYERYKILQIASTMQQIDKIEYKMSDLEKEYQENDLKIKSFLSEINKLKENIENKEIQNNETAKLLNDLQRIISDLNRSQAEINGQISLYNERVMNISKSINEKSILQNKDKDNLISSCIQYENIKRALSLKHSILDKINKLNILNDKKIETINNEIDEYQKIVNNKNDYVIKDFENISNIKGNLLSLNELLNLHNKELEVLIEKKLKCETQINKDKAQYNSLKEQLDKNKKVQSDLNGLINKYTEKAVIIKISIQKNTKEIALIENEIRNKSIKLVNYNNQKNNDRFYSSVDKLLKACEKNSDLPRCYVVSRLFTVEDKFSVALDVALGAAGQDIIVENEFEAKKLITYLKEHNMGRVTFLPMSSIRNVNDIELGVLKNEKGFIDFANNVIKYDTHYTKIFKFLLEKTIICDNIDNAILISKKYPHKFKIVTLDGEIFYPSGSLTGGSLNKSKTQKSKLERITYEIKNELIELNRRKRELKSKSDKLAEEINILNNKTESIRIEINSLARENIELNNSIYAIDMNIKNLENMLCELTQNISDKDNSINNIQEKIDELKVRNNAIITDIDINTYLSKINDLKNHLNKFLKRQIRLNIKKAKLNEQINDLKKRSDNLIDNIIDLIKDLNKTNYEISNLKNNLSEQKNEKESLQNKLKDVQYEIQLNKEKYDNYTIEKQKLIDELSYCRKMENETEINLRLIQEINHKIDIEKARVDIKRENLISTLFNDYGITYEEAKSTDYNIEIDQSEVQKLKREMDSLKDVNIAAIEEYKKSNERYMFLNEQKNDLENAIEKLNIMLKEINKNIEEQFKKQFETIKRKFKELFKIFFGGGNANLVLTDTLDVLNSGIGIEVQPPGKKLQNMILLSGGEKALCAIALLFAFLNVNPSPFCILDEIDAALDEANVERFAKYLSKMGKTVQFIIISHRHGTMLAANTVYGITMQQGMSKLISVKIDEEAV